MRTVVPYSFVVLLVCVVSRASAANCVNNQDMLVSACVCAAGFRVDSYTSCDQGHCSSTPDWAKCHMCPAGTYSAAGDTACAPCAAGTRSAAGAATCTAGVFNTTEDEDATIEVILARIDAIVSGNHVYVDRLTSGLYGQIDAAVNRTMASFDIDKHMASQAPGLYAIIIIGFVGAVLNCLASWVMFVWVFFQVRSLKGVVPQTNAGNGAV